MANQGNESVVRDSTGMGIHLVQTGWRVTDSEGDVVGKRPLQRVVDARERVVAVHESQPWRSDDDLPPWPRQVP